MKATVENSLFTEARLHLHWEAHLESERLGGLETTLHSDFYPS